MWTRNSLLLVINFELSPTSSLVYNNLTKLLYYVMATIYSHMGKLQTHFKSLYQNNHKKGLKKT